MHILDILHELVEHSTMGRGHKDELHGHVDELGEPAEVPAEAPKTPEGA